MDAMREESPIRLEEVSCHSCGSQQGDTLYRVVDHLYQAVPGEFRLVRCRQCQLVYLTPVPVRQDLARCYPADYFWNDFDRRPLLTWQDRVWNLWVNQLVRRRMAFLQKAIENRPWGPVLDVGCGHGLFLRDLQAKTARQVHGIDLQAANIAFLKANHPTILAYRGDFLEWREETRFEAVTMWHVLEHMPDPRAALIKARGCLAPGGVLLIGTQNYQALSRLIQGKQWTLNDVPRHLFHFTESTLRRELASVGFEITHVWHRSEFFPILGSHLFAKYILDRHHRIRPLLGLVLNYLLSPLEAIAIGLGRGCTMTIAARKREPEGVP